MSINNIEKVTSYLNIFECSINLLDQLDVTYQRAFMALPVQEVLYQPSPARERCYDKNGRESYQSESRK